MKNNIKQLFLILFAVFAVCCAVAQNRDRRADLGYLMQYRHNYAVSENGRLWIVTRSGEVLTADNIHSTWHTVLKSKGNTFDYVAAYGDKVAVVAGFIPRKMSPAVSGSGGLAYDFVLRTTNGGLSWDTVFFGQGEHWIVGFCYHGDGRLWMVSSQSSRQGTLFYSADSGQTFITLRGDFDTVVKMESVFMASAKKGIVGTRDNGLYGTDNNWKSFFRLPTPADQQVGKTRPFEIECPRLWKNYILVTQNGKMFYSTAWRKTKWQPMPKTLRQYEVDSKAGRLWGVDNSGRLVCFADIKRCKTYSVTVEKIIGISQGGVYCTGGDCVLRVGYDGKSDTCRFYTTDMSIQPDNYMETVKNNGLLWAANYRNIYLKDTGWYRVCHTPGMVESIKPHPRRRDYLVAYLTTGQMISVDTAGHIQPYRYSDPLDGFVAQGLRSVEITTVNSGCFHYEPDIIVYERNGDTLCETYNNIDSGRMELMKFPVSYVEEALRKISLRYDDRAIAADFGLRDSSMDVEAILKEKPTMGSTSRYSYSVIIVNTVGDTLDISGMCFQRNDFGGHTRFPWLLPMIAESSKVYFHTYKPYLWQALRPMMPDGMLLKNHLDNSTLRPFFHLRTADLLFVGDTRTEMGRAIGESTGAYTHVAIAEVDSVGNTWVIEASRGGGVRRIPFFDFRLHYPRIDVYRVAGPLDTVAVIERAKSFLGQPYDRLFLPDNGALYCSELVREAYLDSAGRYLFDNQPMNFRNKEGRMPVYWERYYEKLGMPVPEGMPGTNPTSLSKSKRLVKML